MSNGLEEQDTQEYKEYWVVSHMESIFDSINFFVDPRKVELVPLEKSKEFAQLLVHKGTTFNYPHFNDSLSTKKLTKKERGLIEKNYEKDFELYEASKKWKS